MRRINNIIGSLKLLNCKRPFLRLILLISAIFFVGLASFAVEESESGFTDTKSEGRLGFVKAKGYFYTKMKMVQNNIQLHIAKMLGVNQFHILVYNGSDVVNTINLSIKEKNKFLHYLRILKSVRVKNKRRKNIGLYKSSTKSEISFAKRRFKGRNLYEFALKSSKKGSKILVLFLKEDAMQEFYIISRLVLNK